MLDINILGMRLTIDILYIFVPHTLYVSWFRCVHSLWTYFPLFMMPGDLTDCPVKPTLVTTFHPALFGLVFFYWFFLYGVMDCADPGGALSFWNHFLPMCNAMWQWDNMYICATIWHKYCHYSTVHINITYMDFPEEGVSELWNWLTQPLHVYCNSMSRRFCHELYAPFFFYM